MEIDSIFVGPRDELGESQPTNGVTIAVSLVESFGCERAYRIFPRPARSLLRVAIATVGADTLKGIT
jgi:hypothetical protein